jgi:hypothetical protein
MIKRATRYAALTIGSGVALTFAMAGSASADEIVIQHSDVTNVGGSFANSGGNVAIGNASTNVAANGQVAGGLLASNQASANNQSNGTATITTGEAKAVGNESTTQVAQATDGNDDPGGGLVLVIQDADVTNAGVGISNTGGNVAVGNASLNVAANGQLALGGVASNNGSASNESNGTANITTGAASAQGNTSATKVNQAASAADGTGLGIFVQDSDVLNLGVAVANSGGNLALGNVSGNFAGNGQGAFGLIASNNGSATNSSNGSATIRTGAASAQGNTSTTNVDQGIKADPAGLTVAIQSAPVLNAGLGFANSGFNGALGNGSLNAAILAQVSFGLLASNTSDIDNLSNGFATVLTGTATGAGNQAVTNVKQSD